MAARRAGRVILKPFAMLYRVSPETIVYVEEAQVCVEAGGRTVDGVIIGCAGLVAFAGYGDTVVLWPGWNTVPLPDDDGECIPPTYMVISSTSATLKESVPL